jgi:choline dehydrogenase-like flavoprotein
MIRSLSTGSLLPLIEHDVCVVGAGAAGLTICAELVREGKRVVLLESGSRIPEFFYMGSKVGLPESHDHAGVLNGRARVLGGTTTMWGGQILEFDPIDFETRDWIPGSGWPFRKGELREFYSRALRVEGLEHALRGDGEVWQRLRLPQRPLTDFDRYFTRWCPEPNFAKLHRATIESPLVNAWINATVVSMSLQDGSVQSVTCCAEDGTEAIFNSPCFVFCLGGIESCRFFLQAIRGEHSCSYPWNRSGLLGRHFQDHLAIDVGELLTNQVARFRDEFENVFLRGFKYQPKIKMSSDAQQRLACLNVAATIQIGPRDFSAQNLKNAMRKLLAHELPFNSWGDLLRAGAELPFGIQHALRLMLRNRAGMMGNDRFFLRVHCEQMPLSESAISLDNSIDRYGLRNITLDWRISDLEIESIRSCARLAVAAFADLAFLQLFPWLESDAEVRGRVEDSNHHMGGMRMGGDDSSAIVDENLKLFGTSNCYVCSAAVFPTSGFSNPTHTVIALAIRLVSKLTSK